MKSYEFKKSSKVLLALILVSFIILFVDWYLLFSGLAPESVDVILDMKYRDLLSQQFGLYGYMIIAGTLMILAIHLFFPPLSIAYYLCCLKSELDESKVVKK